jgi:CRISPR/Cas system-associated exonuclease Cas4 (RecB family)
MSYSLKDILLYTSCPLKLKYRLEGGEKLLYDVNDKLLIAEALKDTFIKYFQITGLGRTPTNKYLYSYFSSKWSEYTAFCGDLAMRTKSLSDVMLQAQEKIFRINKFLGKREIVAAAFPYERSIKGHTITDTIDLILVDQPKSSESGTELSLISLDTSMTKSNPHSFHGRIRALLNLAYAKRDLINAAARPRMKLLNLFLDKEMDIDLEREHRFNYPRMISSICTAIDNKMYYPTSNVETCSTCIFRKECAWSS